MPTRCPRSSRARRAPAAAATCERPAAVRGTLPALRCPNPLPSAPFHLRRYGRSFNPTVRNLGRQLAAMEGAAAAYCCSSGMAAVSSALLALCSVGDHIVCSNAVYGGTFALLKARRGICASMAVQGRGVQIGLPLCTAQRRHMTDSPAPPEDTHAHTCPFSGLFTLQVRHHHHLRAHRRPRGGGGGGDAPHSRHLHREPQQPGPGGGRHPAARWHRSRRGGQCAGFSPVHFSHRPTLVPRAADWQPGCWAVTSNAGSSFALTPTQRACGAAPATAAPAPLLCLCPCVL